MAGSKIFTLRWRHACMLFWITIPWVLLSQERVAGGDEPDAATRERVRTMAARIDHWVAQGLAQNGLTASPPADDVAWFRRVHLDLWGSNPEPTAIAAFVSDQASDKRERQVWSMLRSIGHARHLSDLWTGMLLPGDQSGIPNVQRESLRRWIFARFAENQRYDRIVGDLLVSRGNPAEQPTAFYTSLELKPEKLAERTSRIFLGVALDCAQCHDHPFESWKQTDFWSLAAYFSQVTSNNNASRMSMQSVTDRESGEVTLPETTTTVAPRPLIREMSDGLQSGTRRQQLAVWLTSKENHYFLKATVNRIWSFMMGRGLVEPVDDLGTQAKHTHPELLTDLSEFFRDSQFDIRLVQAAIAMSATYGRSTSVVSPAPDPRWFASMLPKPLTSRQMARCLRQAARDKQPSSGEEDLWTRLAAQLGTIRGDGSAYSAGVLQSLLTQHGDSIHQLVDASTSRLLSALHAPHLSPTQRVDWMYLAVLSRTPSAQERQRIESFLKPEPEGPSIAAWESDLLWALINSTEFAMTP
jgi:hypothetical protein